jgi:hypothetical protein
VSDVRLLYIHRCSRADSRTKAAVDAQPSDPFPRHALRVPVTPHISSKDSIRSLLLALNIRQAVQEAPLARALSHLHVQCSQQQLLDKYLHQLALCSPQQAGDQIQVRAQRYQIQLGQVASLVLHAYRFVTQPISHILLTITGQMVSYGSMEHGETLLVLAIAPTIQEATSKRQPATRLQRG